MGIALACVEIAAYPTGLTGSGELRVCVDMPVPSDCFRNPL